MKKPVKHECIIRDCQMRTKGHWHCAVCGGCLQCSYLAATGRDPRPQQRTDPDAYMYREA